MGRGWGGVGIKGGDARRQLTSVACAVLCCGMLCCAALCCCCAAAVLRCAALYRYAVLCCAVLLCYAVPCCSVLCAECPCCTHRLCCAAVLCCRVVLLCCDVLLCTCTVLCCRTHCLHRPDPRAAVVTPLLRADTLARLAQTSRTVSALFAQRQHQSTPSARACAGIRFVLRTRMTQYIYLLLPFNSVTLFVHLFLIDNISYWSEARTCLLLVFCARPEGVSQWVESY